MNVRTLVPLILALLFVGTGCFPYWSGAKVRKDVDELKSEQKELTERLTRKEAELTEMISSARADVDQLDTVMKDATELLQRNSADFGAEMSELRQEMERMRGKTEEVDFKLSKLQQELELFKEDVDLRFADGGGASLPDDPNELYKMSAEKVQAGEHRLARKGFEKFLKLAPKDRRADEARFFVGETYFKEKQWVSAIYEYQKILKNYSKSDRLDDATFRIGESFVKLGKCQEAKVFFDTVVKDFKKSKFRSSARSELKKIEGGQCG